MWVLAPFYDMNHFYTEHKMREHKKQGSHCKRLEAPKTKQLYGATLLRLVLLVLLAGVLLLNLFTYVFSVVHYYGQSMEPSLQDRQILVVHKTDKVSRGDMVAFYYNNKVLVRRIVAAGGSSLEIEPNGRVIVDGNILSEPYVAETSLGQCNITFPHTVPVGEFFVMGDNRPISMDSRLKEIGTVPQSRILGKVLFALG